jgi:hypothetical protein
MATRPHAGAAQPAARDGRHDGPTTCEQSPETRQLRRWIARQAARYDDLLATIAAAPRPATARISPPRRLMPRTPSHRPVLVVSSP